MSGRATKNPRLYRCRRGTLRWLQLLVFLGASAVWAQDRTHKTPPKTRTDDVKEVLHGVEVVDPYRWLEDSESPKTRAGLTGRESQGFIARLSAAGAKVWQLRGGMSWLRRSSRL